MSSQSQAFHSLYRSLNQRKRPEDIAETITDVLAGTLNRKESKQLYLASQHSIKNTIWGYTSMLQSFAAPVGLKKQIRKSEELFGIQSQLSVQACSDPLQIEGFLLSLSAILHKQMGQSQFTQRLNRKERLASGMDLSKRRYNKLFRLVGRMEAKLKTLITQLQKLEITKIGKSSLASKITWEQFSVDVDTGCFIAYYTARCNLRSQFTISGQEKPFDTIAAMLLRRCQKGDANYLALAHVYPEQTILKHLNEEEKGRLLGQWYEILGDIAEILQQTWKRSSICRETMIVQRGNDSSTWNSAARAWNKARTSWIALLYTMKLDSVLDTVCPGKVLSLVAGDVAAWHRSAGSGLSPDTLVWNEVPLPWQVIKGERRCTRDTISWVCKKHGISPRKKGWIGPTATARSVPFRPTPELVHGVTVASPLLASALRKAGVFSGKIKRT